MIASLVAALRFLTRIPVPGRETRLMDLRRAVAWFPLVGGLVGLATAGVFALGRHLWPAPLAATVAVAFGLMLTGGFHEDGATDSADGLGGGWTRERVLEIMKDSRIGAYGAMALWALPLAMVWGRWSISLLMGLLPPISQGLAKEVGGDRGWGPFLGASAILAISHLLMHRCPGLPRAAAAAIVMALAWSLYLKHRLGGHSGDLLGAGSQLVESAVLLALVA